MTDLDLPALGLGTSGNDEYDQCAETVEAALEMGYRHVDTAQMYDNEEAVGEGIRRADVDRDDVVLATKVHPDNLAYEDVIETTHESLDRLGVDAVDMLYVHWPMGAYDPEDTLPAFDELHDDGLTDHVCVSNFTPELVDEAQEILDAHIAANQVEMHPLLQQDELREVAAEHDHYLVAYAPIGQAKIFDDPVLSDVAEKYDTSPAAVCLAWEMSKDRVVPIPKGTGEHVRENLAARELELSEEDLARIDDIARSERLIDPDDAAWNR